MPKTVFDSREVVSGSFGLKTKKSISGNRLLASLVGYKIVRERRNGEDKRTKREIYRNDTLIEESKVYPSGYQSRYEFSIDAIQENKAENKFNKMINSELAKTAIATLSYFSEAIQDPRVEWHIEVRLDAAGIDLLSSQSISIQNGRLTSF